MIPTFQQGQFGRSRNGNHIAQAIQASARAGGWWHEFEDNAANSTFTDETGNFNMTARETGATANTSTVTDASGFGNLSRTFFANNAEGRTAYIPNASAFKLPNSDWTYGAWLQMAANTGGSARFIIGNLGATGTDWQVYLSQSGSGNDLQLQVSTDGTASAATIDSNYVPTVGRWVLVVCSLSRAADTIHFRWRDTVAGSMSSGSAAFATALYTGSTNANFNVNDALSSDSTYFSGTRAGVTRCAQAFCYMKAATDAEFDYLYNAASGRNWTQIVSDS